MPPNTTYPQSSLSPDCRDNDSRSAAAAPASDSASEPPIAAGLSPMTAIPFDQPIALTESGTPVLNPRSCIICRKRKVRCDKTMPCTNCRRAQIACVFPAPGRARRQPRLRDPNAPPKPSTSQRETELIKRLRKLEGVVNELSSQVETKGSTGGSRSFSAEAEANGDTGGTNQYNSGSSVGNVDSPRMLQGVAAVREAAEEAKRKTEGHDPSGIQKQLGRLVLHDGGKTSRYINRGYWSKLNDEVATGSSLLMVKLD